MRYLAYLIDGELEDEIETKLTDEQIAELYAALRQFGLLGDNEEIAVIEDV